MAFSHLVYANWLAQSRNRPLLDYFIDNIVVHTIVQNGYYSMAVIGALLAVAIISKVFRTILLSLLLALVGIGLVIFIYQAYQDFEFIPPNY